MKIILVEEQQGFTLIELMIIVVIIAVLAAIAIPSYQDYIRKSEASKVNQAMLNLAQDLERYKARNFNYVGFKIANTTYQFPKTTYTATIVDGSEGNPALTAPSAVGQTWIMRANSNDLYSKKFNFLLTSDGFKCKSKNFSEISYSSCGAAGVTQW